VSLVFDSDKSKIRIRTFAEGLLARLAHDLELVATKTSGHGTRASATVEVDIHAIDVAGVLEKDGRVDDRGLSPSDKHDCLDKMRREVFRAKPGDVVRVEATLDGKRARLAITTPNGRTVERSAGVDVRDEDGGGVRVKGKVEISLASIGSERVKGPMNAFRVKDIVEVHFDAVFRADDV
jgi:hypothetical protein